ncbi:MAG: IS4 family transposase, partial [Rectinemataceae bacterium]|nr:IS4 family transposase [Rectinemataceae bacterium]
MIVDGTSVSMPDTPENQKEYPQPSGQKKGCGFPVARILAVFSLASGAIVKFASSSLRSGEQTLFKGLMHVLSRGDVILSDRGFCSYSAMEELMGKGVDFVVRMREKIIKNFTVVRKLGKDDVIIRWRKPPYRPKGMSREEWKQLPDKIYLRKIRYHVAVPGFRTDSVTILTSLIDPVLFPKESFAGLYLRRWNAELNLRHIKTTMKMDVLRCLTPDMIRKEILIHFIVYNLVRQLMLRSAVAHSLRPDSVSFKYSLTAIGHWMQAISFRNSKKHAEIIEEFILSLIADAVLPHRPFRREPRAVKRRQKPYQLLTKPRKIFMEIQH